MVYYLLGIKGAGVSSLACILHDLSNKVVGYDDVKDYRFTEEELKKRNIEICYDNDFFDENMIVIASAAFKKEHKEIVRLKNLGVTFKDYQEVIGDLSRKFNTISIAGTHGKTTTTSLLSQLFNKVEGFGCNYFIGDGHGYASLENNYFALESCEFNKHFLNYNPNISIITNIEIEHMEVFKDLDDIIDTYNKLINNTSKYAIVCKDSKYCNLLDNKDNKIIYYGKNEDCDVKASNVSYHSNGVSFDLYYKGELYDKYDLSFFGEHMLLNSLSVIAVCILENFPKEMIKEHINKYVKANRRFEETFIGENVIIDDYAHHPSEVKATILAALQKYPDKKVVAVFRPNTYSRTKLLYEDFAEVLSMANYVYVTDIYCDREKQEDFEGITSNLILERCTNSKIISCDNVDTLLNYENSVVCFMSCKDITDLKSSYIKLLEEKSKGGN